MKKALAFLIILMITSQGFSVLQSHASSQATLSMDTSGDNGADWPMFHHDLMLSGVSSSIAPNTNNTIWIYDTGSSIYSSPAVVNGVVYIGAMNGKLYALNSSNGALIWTYQTGNAIYSSPAVANGNVYFLSTDGRIYALKADTGFHVWDVVVGHGPWDWSSPAVHGNKVFIAASNGWVYCLDSDTGAFIWSTFIGGSPNSMIAVANGKVFTGTHNFDATAPTLVALDELTGAIVWTYNHTMWHSPTVGMINCNGVAVADGDEDGDLEVYFGIVTWNGAGNEAICLDESNGNEVWTYTLNGWSTSTPAVHDGRVFIGSDDGNIYALNATTGTYLWSYTTKGPVWTAPAVADGKVFFGSWDHVFYAVDESTGALVWSYNTSRSRVISSPAIADGKVFVGNENGKVYAFGLKDNEPPVIQNVRHEPLYPMFDDEIFFYADVTDNVAIDKVQLNYTFDGGATWLLKDMQLLKGDTYSTSLGPFNQFQIIGFYVIAYDTSGNMAWGSEIVTPLPEPPKVAPVVVSDENPAPLPNGEDVWYDTTDTSTTVYVDLWELGLYSPGLLYYIWYSIDGGLTWIKEELTQVTDYIRKFDIPSLTNILFKIETSDGKSSRVYWIIIGPWKYPIYLYFSTNEKYYPVQGLDFDYEQTGNYDITNNKESYDMYFSDYRPTDLDGDGTPDAPAYTYMNPKSLDDGCLVIEYWLYYAFNEYPIIDDVLRDDHEHDFESIYIWVDLATGNIKKMACSQHKWVNHYLFDVQNPPLRINLAVEEGGHGTALLKDDNKDGLPDSNMFGYYELAYTLDYDKPWFWAGWFGERINPDSFVARLYPWVIYDPRIPSSKLHLFDDSSILTAGLDWNVMIPQLSLDTSEIANDFQWITNMLGKSYLLKTNFSANLLLDSGMKLQFLISAPLYRQEFREPAKMWNKVSWRWWSLKQIVKVTISFIVVPAVIKYFALATAAGLIVRGAGLLTNVALSIWFDPVQGAVMDFEGNVLGYSNVANNLPGGTVVLTRNMTDNLYDLFVVFTNRSNEYVYEIRGIEPEDNYNFTVLRVDADGNGIGFDAINIPIHSGEVHRYVINWTMLENEEQGVDVFIDKDGDGTFEQRFNSDSKLTNEEFKEATADNIPPTTNLEIGEPKFIDPIKGVYVSSTTSFTLVAEDNPGGTGVASTFYRIYNVIYDSGWLEFTEPFYLTGLLDGEYSIDYYSTDNIGNTEPTNTVNIILDNTPPSTTLTIGEPKFISDIPYVTPDTPFTLEATDTGSGIHATAYRIYNNMYDSGWQTYTLPFYLTSLTDGVYTIEYNSTDNTGNVEPTHAINITLFSWNFIYQDTYGRGTTLKINLAHKFFQFIRPNKDYGIRKATYMRQCGRTIIIQHCDSELRLITISVDAKLDFCYAMAWDLQTRKCYLLIDKAGIE